MLSREERIFSELLVARGLLAREILEKRDLAADSLESASDLDCLLAESGVDPSLSDPLREEARAIDRALEADLPPGSRLGDFRLIREIGRGGMGVVFEAEQESLGRRVALKVLPAGAALDERLASRFLREARAAGRLHHPGIVPILASGRHDGALFFAMELVEGPTLAGVLRDGPIDPERAARWIAEVARAVDHAHRSGLIHRDIKPENILLAPDGRARLADFGLVHDVTAGPCTLSHFVLGTPAYIAPEQALGHAVDRRTDVYGLGAVLYTLLSGRAPYVGKTPSAVLARLLQGPPPSLRSLCPGLPSRLVAICERAMAYEARERHDDAAALADEIESYLRGDRPVAAPLRRSWRSRLGILAALAGTTAILSLLLATRDRSRLDPVTATATATWKLASSTSAPARPALSPEGNRVAYCERTSDGYRISSLNLDTLEATDLSGSLDLLAWPAFSRDGRRLAYATHSSMELPILDLELGTTKHLHLNVPCGIPSWSPDGRELFFTEMGGPGPSVAIGKAWVVDALSGELRHSLSMDARVQGYSPNGLRVAFGSLANGQVDLWTTRADGTDPVRLTRDPDMDWSPVWTPDGPAVLFGSTRGGIPGLWRLSVDESTGHPQGEPTPALSSIFVSTFFTSISDDGRRLAISSASEPGRLVRFSLDPGSRQLLHSPTAFPRHPAASRSPEVSPDGASLAFTAHSPDEDIASLPVDGKAEPIYLTADAFSDRAPRWSPDGSRIAFQSNRSGTWEIWTMLPDGNDLHQVTHTPQGSAVSPVWSPDGLRIVYAVEGSGLFVISSSAERGDPPRESLEPSGAARFPFEPSSWSTDGRTLAGSAGGVVLYSIPSRSYRRLTDFGEKPAWLPDGRLLFTTERAIWVADPHGGEPREVFSAAPSGVTPGLGISADGREVYASLTASSAELWVVDLPQGSRPSSTLRSPVPTLHHTGSAP